MNKKYNILCISGGGIRGIIPAQVLSNIEGLTGKKIHEMFDLIVGTSTGGIIASAIGAGYTPKEVVNMYVSEGPKIFDRSTLHKVRTIGGVFGSKYPQNGLHDSVHALLGDKPISTSLVPIIACSFDTIRNTTVLFKSWELDYNRFTFSDIAMATSAAPTYFPPYKIGGANYIDGGIYVNSPVQIGWTEALKAGFLPDDVNILSIGTGRLDYKQYDTQNWGDKNWIITGTDNPIIDMMMQASLLVDHYSTSKIFKNFYHLDLVLDPKNGKMDNVDAENLRDLQVIGNKLAATTQLNDFINNIILQK